MSSLENLAGPKPDRESECAEAIEEIIADFGLRAFLSAMSHTTASDAATAVHQQATLRAIQCVIREIVYGENPRLEAEIISMGSGIMLADEATQTRIAAKYGLGRAAISKRVVAYCETNGLPPSPCMRPERDRAIYAATNRHEKLPRAI